MLLFCIPHAGGSTLSYIKWKKYLNKSITFVPLDLPGHITRQEKPLCQNFYSALEDLYQLLHETISGTQEAYSIFGHSLGAVFAYELYHKLEENGDRMPSGLFFSGRWPPYINKKEDQSYKSLEEFKSGFIKTNNLGKLSVTNQEFGEYFYEVIYMDLKLLDTYKASPVPYIITSDMTVLWGSKDKSMSYREVSDWSNAAEGSIHFKMIEGDHLFPVDNVSETVGMINLMLACK